MIILTIIYWLCRVPLTALLSHYTHTKLLTCYGYMVAILGFFWLCCLTLVTSSSHCCWLYMFVYIRYDRYFALYNLSLLAMFIAAWVTQAQSLRQCFKLLLSGFLLCFWECAWSGIPIAKLKLRAKNNGRPSGIFQAMKSHLTNHNALHSVAMTELLNSMSSVYCRRSHCGLLINMHTASRVLKFTGYWTYHHPVTVYMCAHVMTIWQLREHGRPASGKSVSIVRRTCLNFYGVRFCLTSQLAMKRLSLSVEWLSVDYSPDFSCVYPCSVGETIKA